jgi:hypothetical protein
MRRVLGVVRSGPTPLSRGARSYLASPRWKTTTADGAKVIARAVVAVEPWRACDELAARVQTVLATQQIEYLAVQPLNTRVTQWAISIDDLTRAVAGLRAEFAGEGYYLSAGRRGVAPRLIEEVGNPDLGGDRTLWLSRFLIDERGRTHTDAESCQLVMWRKGERGDLVIANKNAVVHQIDDQRPVATIDSPTWNGTIQPRPAVLRTPDASEIDFAVDAVYMWVDDSDPAWRERREQARRSAQDRGEPVEAAALAPSRYRDRGELRASLRSLEMFAPWIRQIYLVTDQQRPSWLDADSARVKVVDHREFFTDVDALPCFNSRAIGSQLHRIPGLAEHYLILNDDVLFNKPASPYDFFTPEGALKIVLSRSHLPRLPEALLTTLEHSRTNSARLILRDFGQRVTRLFAHAPLAQRRSIGAELMQAYPEEIGQTMRHQFRSPLDYETNAWLHQYRALFTGRAVLAATPFAYFNSDAAATQQRLAADKDFADALFLCINDTDGGAGDDGSWVTSWLQRNYPLPTAFELSTADTPSPVS